MSIHHTLCLCPTLVGVLIAARVIRMSVAIWHLIYLHFAFLCHVEMKGPKHIMHHVIGDGDDYVHLDSFIVPWGFVSYVLLD